MEARHHHITLPSSLLTMWRAVCQAVTRGFITAYNRSHEYIHFTLGKKDGEARDYRWLGRIVASYVKWLRVLFKERGAIVHFNLALEQRSLIRDSPLIILARCFRRPVVVHIHGGEFLAAKVMPTWLKWLAATALADGPVIVLSEAEREILQAKFPRAGAVVLPNCVDLGTAETFRRSYSSDEPLKILFHGPNLRIQRGRSTLRSSRGCNDEGPPIPLRDGRRRP